MEVMAVIVIAVVAGAVGIGLGILAAPTIGRIADRVGRPDDEDEERDGR